MPTKKVSIKKGSAKKSKKASAKKTSATAKATQVGSKIRLDFPLSASKVAAIQRCLAKGTLRVTINKVDLAAGRLRDPWLYD